MAAVPPPPPNWTALDDLLLKNAVEAGYSLEWIAARRVKFSQPYTLKQIQARWYSLLYDPVISAEASARMVELERTIQSRKRKPNSVRKQYYTKRKRLLKERDISSPVDCGPSDFHQANVDMPVMPILVDNIPEKDDIFAGLTSSQFEFIDKEAQLFMDAYVSNPNENSHNDSFSSLLFDSVNNGQLLDVGPKEMYSSPALGLQRQSGRAVNGKISCQLNMEDPDIPSNEDVFLPFRVPFLFESSGPHGKNVDPYSLLASTFENIPTFRKACMTVSSRQSGSTGNIQIGGHGMRSKLTSNGIQQQFAPKDDGTSEDLIFRRLLKDCIDNLIPKKMVQRTRNLDVTFAGPSRFTRPDSFQRFERSLNSSKKDEAESSKVPLVSDSEDDSDHVPCFSDLEAMILEMDQDEMIDLQSDDEGPQYNDDEIKTIIRLEQSANSHMHRAIAAAGAFAVLFGHHSKHFIKKTEVLIGRATDDLEVDIDLGRERSGVSISRRQAIIKMDVHGTFIMRNVGKCPIIVNGNEVATRMSVALPNGCLIEIRKVAFIFETNPAQIKQHVDSVKASCSSDPKTSVGH